MYFFSDVNLFHTMHTTYGEKINAKIQLERV
jgi:hypothetical protein